ncbi:MLX-interacting protein-like isoform X2 [Scylla paramamosain]|uniref:MLX-interacting protein-like isoform X2 n=1 Tax=Scylla paramamosain TaxID=85552 RepID=UPI003082DFBA
MTADITTVGSITMGRKGEKEVIHSGHFMVSDFEADAQDDEENVLLEIPGDIMEESAGSNEQGRARQQQEQGVITYAKKSSRAKVETVSIDSSLTKLFNAMSIAYRHKITSPKWNRFKGLKLRWKDKIRLNNVIWRCWHMQFIRKKRMTVCQFALDVDIHNKPEAIVLEGKYWKRQMEAVTAEYKKWRIYYRNKICGKNILESDSNLFDLDGMDLTRNSYGVPLSFEDGDFSEFMDFTDVLFSSLMSAPQPFAFPNPREIARGTGNSDFIQPGLIQLQPNLDDFMDIVEPLQEMLAVRGAGLPSVPEEDMLPEVEGASPELPVAPSAPATTASTTTGMLYSTSPTTTTFLPSPTHHQQQQQQYRPAIHHHQHHQQDVQQQQQQQAREPQQQQQRQQQLVPVPTQSPPVYQSPVPLQQLPQPSTPPHQLQQAHTPPLPRTFLRSHSQQELGAGQAAAAAAAPQHDAFAVPKSVPRRRSHSSGGSSSSSSSGAIVGSPSLAPYQMISGLPNPAPAQMPPLNTAPHRPSPRPQLLPWPRSRPP